MLTGPVAVAQLGMSNNGNTVSYYSQKVMLSVWFSTAQHGHHLVFELVAKEDTPIACWY